MTVKEMTEVMLGFAAGKRVEMRSRGLSNSDIWCPIGNPNWDWAWYEYRLAPEPILTPWELDQKYVGVKVRLKKGRAFDQSVFVITGFYENTFILGGVTRQTPKELLQNYETINGQPCGTEVES